MLTFKNDPAVKQKYVNRLAEHLRLEQIVQGTGWDGQRGCNVGCVLHEYDHAKYEDEIGPEWYARLCDNIFEGLPKKDAPQFAFDSIDYLPVGVNVEPVRWKLAILRHKRDIKRLVGNKEPYAQQCRQAIEQVIAYCEAKLANTTDEYAAESAECAAWSAAESSAWFAAKSAVRSAIECAAECAVNSAAWSATWSAIECAAECAVNSAAWSAVRSAECAAWSAAESSAESAAWSAAESSAESARSAHYIWEAATLIELLKELERE